MYLEGRLVSEFTVRQATKVAAYYPICRVECVGPISNLQRLDAGKKGERRVGRASVWTKIGGHRSDVWQ